MGKTVAQREAHKRYLRKHPEYAIYRLRVWISREKDPEKLAWAKWELEQWLKILFNKK